MADTIDDRNTMYMAFKYFIFKESTEIKTLYESLVLTDKDLFDSINRYLQCAISTWLESQVMEKLPELANELSVISTLNTALGITENTYKAIQVILSKFFDNMPIPGMVVEMLGYSWIPAMVLLRRISIEPWTNVAETSNLLDTLRAYAKPAWEILSQPKIILEAILNKRNILYSDEEINDVYTSLRSKPRVYETKEEVFYVELDKQLDNISYRRNIADIKRLWSEKTKTKNVREWCNTENCPIMWLFDGSDSTDIATIVNVQDDKQPVDKNALEHTLAFLNSCDLAVLFNKKAIADGFFANIGKNYREAFQKDSHTLYARLKTDNKLSSDVYSWSGNVPQIRKVLDDFLRDKHVEEAKERVRSMSVDELRSVICELLDEMPQLYTFFLKK
jgi:predicted house-cleaning noncanonical NTP pyrophosphatase (MazG superfamily)